MRRLIVPLMIIILAFVLLALIITADVPAHYKPGTHNAVHAIQLAWCGKANHICAEGNEAIEVAQCEAAQYWAAGHPWDAVNGQYRGMFQMGSSERKKWGHGSDPWKQAFAAHRYYEESGSDWSPWDPRCRP